MLNKRKLFGFVIKPQLLSNSPCFALLQTSQTLLPKKDFLNSQITDTHAQTHSGINQKMETV